MELVARHAEAAETPAVGIELLLTVAEEQGLRGAKAFDASQLQLRSGLRPRPRRPGRRGDRRDPDPAEDPAPTSPGVEAHAGIRPEDGSSAIAAAAAAISRMELGRLDEETTANVGLIEGGTSGNVVAGHCGIVRRGPQPRRRARRRGRRGDGRRLRLGRERARLRRRRAGSKSSSAATSCPRTRRPWRWPRRGCAERGSSPRGSRSAAAATPTRCASTASTASCSPTGPTPSTPPTSTSPPRRPRRRCSRSARGSSPAPPRTTGERPAEAAPRGGGRRASR